MAVRKIEYTKGEELNIRSFHRIENKIVFENIKELMDSNEQLVVKCGKSYWDVTAAPEIFEQAEEFDLNELTNIEKREMQQTVAQPVHAYEEESTVSDPMNMLYQKTEEEEEEPEYVFRRTYYLTELVLEVIEAYRYVNKTEISETVRELILRGASPEILEMAEKNVNLHKGQANKNKNANIRGTRKKNRVIL